MGGTGVAINFYSHTMWQRRWTKCRLRRGVPGKLLSNDDCGRGQPEQSLVQTDSEMIEFDALPRIRSHKQLRAVSRDFIFSGVVSALANYRASKRNGVYTFTNAVGDSLRYRP